MKKILLVALLGIGFYGVNAQNPLSDDSKTESGVIYPDYMRISRPLREIWAEEKMDPNEKTEFEIKNEEAPDKRMGKRVPQTFDYSLENNGVDFTNDGTIIQTENGSRPSNGTRANWAGIGNGGAFPYDPSGAAGPNHYVQAVNATTYRIYNKTTGANMGQGSVGSLWSPATGNMGDPIIMYDRFADRWFISQFGQSGSSNMIYIAISTTPDPTGTYYTYSFTSPQFPDYLKFSVWHNGYYMTANTGTQRVFCFERSVMLTGGTARSVYTSFNPPRAGGFFVPMPGDSDGSTISTGPCPIFSYECSEWGGTFTDQINIYNATVTWGATPAMTIAAATGSPLNTAAFNGSYDPGWDDIDQPGTAQMLDGIGGIIQYRAQYRVWAGHNSVVLCWPVQISTGERSIMWAELRQTAGTWAIYQQGIYDPDAYYRWVGSIAMDDNGNIALCYAKSGATPTAVYPSLCYTGRLASDPLGQMTVTETLVQAGTGYQTGANRFGDYAQTTLDPDGMTFWHTAQYNGGSNGSSVQRTRIYSFQLQSVLNAGVSIVANDADNSICTGTSVTFTATPTNGGTAPVYQWKLNGNNVGTNSTTYTNAAMANGDVVTCVMTSNMPGVLNNPATSNAITMTVNNIVTPSVSITSTDADNTFCSGTVVTFTATPTNGGTPPAYQWKRNGANVGSNSPNYTNSSLANGDVIEVVMTSSAACATPSTATSNSFTMTVTPASPASVSIAGDNTICLDESTTFTATPTNGGSTPSYQWKKNGGNVGTNSATYTSSTLANGDVITCVMTSSATCVTPLAPTSNSITMSVTTVTTPTITQNGGVLSSSSATGNQWYLDGVLLVGETNQSITVTQSGVYTVQVTINGCTSNMSAGNNATVGIEEAGNPYLLATFPNPTDGNFIITFNADRSEKYKIELFNELGQVIVSQEVAGHSGSYQLPINLVKPAAGMYTIKLTNGAQETIKKVVVY